MLTSAPIVTMSYGIRQVILRWSAVTGATHYQMLRKANGSSNYLPLNSMITATEYSDTVPVHLVDWMNVSYVVAACNNSGCTNSSVVGGLDSNEAIGYFKASNPDAGDFLGSAVALSSDGNTLIVGANNEASNGTSPMVLEASCKKCKVTILTASKRLKMLILCT